MKKTLFLISFLVLSAGWAAAQSRISGTVVDENDELVIGASIQVKGTNVGTSTDIDGTFSILVPKEGKIFVVSFVGMTTKEVSIKQNIKIVLESDTKVLEEVVVTAMGIKRAERSLGYAVSKVDKDAAIQKAEPDMLRSLDGKIPGVNISSPSGAAGSATRITIRGTSSFLGSNKPLYIVDGIPYSSSEISSSDPTNAGGAYGDGISTLDPNDIESMNILKGAVAAALYGSRASNGVVLITTKSGSQQKELSGKGTEVTINSSYTFEKISGLPNYQNSFGTGSNFRAQGSNGSWGASFDDVKEVPISMYGANIYRENYPDLPEILPYKAQKDNVKNLFRTGGIYDLSLSVNKFVKTGNFSTTISTVKQDSYIPYSDFERHAISLGGNQQLANGLRVGGNLSYSRTTQNGPMFGNNQSSSIGASSFARALILGRNWDMSLPYETPEGASLFYVGSQADNPLWSWKYNIITTTMDRTVANVNLGYNITKWLSADYKLGINDYKMERKEVLNLGSRGLGGKGRILKQTYNTQEIESTFLLNLNKKLNDEFNIKASLGHNVNQFNSHNTKIVGMNIMSAGVYNLTNTESQTVDIDYYLETRLWAILGDFTAGYKNFAFLSLAARNDFSSTLPVGNQSYFYPSVGGSFIFSDAFKINEDIIKFGKVRLSWARVGNDASAYYKNGFYLLGQPYLGQPLLGSPSYKFDENLKPEFTYEWETGLEVQLLKSRLNLDLTLYSRKSINQIAPLSLPTTTGYYSYYTNFGRLDNKGIEIGLQIVPILTKNFKWDIYGTYTQNRSKIVELSEGIERVSLNTGFATPKSVLDIGQPYGMLVGSKLARDEDGNLLVDPSSGFYLLDNEEGYIGNPNPDFKASITNSFTYKGISLSFLADMQKGGAVYSAYITDLLGRGVTKDTEDRYGARILPGVWGDPSTKKALLDANGNKITNSTQVTESDLWFTASSSLSSFATNGADEVAVYDATIFRLRELTISYQLPKKLLAKTFIGSANVSFVARNLWYLAPNVPKNSNYDPTISSYGAGNVQGIDYTTAPNTKRYGFNLKLTF